MGQDRRSSPFHISPTQPYTENRDVIRQAVLRTAPSADDHPYPQRLSGGGGSGSSRERPEEEAALQLAPQLSLAPLSMQASSFAPFTGMTPSSYAVGGRQPSKEFHLSLLN